MKSSERADFKTDLTFWIWPSRSRDIAKKQTSNFFCRHGVHSNRNRNSFSPISSQGQSIINFQHGIAQHRHCNTTHSKRLLFSYKSKTTMIFHSQLIKQTNIMKTYLAMMLILSVFCRGSLKKIRPPKCMEIFNSPQSAQKVTFGNFSMFGSFHFWSLS